MVRATDVIYTPRSDEEVFRDLEKGIISPETRESLELADDQSPAVKALKAKIESIAGRLIQANGLDSDTYTPDVYISADKAMNAMIVPSAQRPLLIVTVGLLKEVRSEDELAGVIAHELGHKLLREKANGTHNGGASKVEEIGADVIAVKLLEDAGYNLRGLITLSERFGEEHFRIINVDDVQAAKTLEEKAYLVERLTDPRPSGNLRIRSMENAIVALNRSRGKTGTDQPHVQLDREFYGDVNGVTYESPLQAGLQRVGYFSMPEEQKIEILTGLVKDNFPPTNKTCAERLPEIADHIAQLKVNFRSPTQAEAFAGLADEIMGDKRYDGRLVFPKKAGHFSSLDDILYPPLKKAWERGHQSGILGVGQDPNRQYIGKLSDLKVALEGFMSASNAEEAERCAAQIVEISGKVSPSYKRGLDWPGFYPPTEEAVKKEIKRTGTWTPPYTQHVEWYQETGSENIQKVLWGMSLAVDPWVEGIIGKMPDNAYKYNVPTVPSEYGGGQNTPESYGFRLPVYENTGSRCYGTRYWNYSTRSCL
jgi:hypothetical protein